MNIAELTSLINQKAGSGEASEEELSKLKALLALLLGGASAQQNSQPSGGSQGSQASGEQQGSGGSLMQDAEAQHQAGDGCAACSALAAEKSKG